MKINLRKVKLLLQKINPKKIKLLIQKTFFLYIILILLGLNSYVGETFAAQTPSNQSHFDNTLTFSLSIGNTALPVLWSRQVLDSISIPEPEPISLPSGTLTPIPYPTLTPSPSPTPTITQEPVMLLSILDENEEALNEILWGSLVPGGEYNRTLILNNEGTDSLNVTMRVENWLPLKAESFISASLYQNVSQVDSQGVLIGSSEKIELKLFLKINPLIDEIDEFEMDFVFIATPIENLMADDLPVVIKIVSNS